MRILFDENFPPRGQIDYDEHEYGHVISVGWRGIQNGELLAKAESAGYDVLITLDSNIPSQNELAGKDISVYVLLPEGQGVQAIRSLAKEVLFALESYRPGEVKVFTNRKRPSTQA